MLENPSQIKKNIKSNNQTKNTIHIKQYDKQNTQERIVECILDEMASTNQISDILFLGRFKHQKDILARTSGLRVRSRSISSETHPEINFKFKTIHSSKGLEADAVVILECNSGKHGFPSEITDDPILSLV